LSANKSILLITSGQPSLNPRIVKEADALSDAGYNVTMLYAYWNKWGTEQDKQLLSKKNWRAIRVAGDPEQNKVTFFFSRIIFKLSQLVCNATRGAFFIEWAIARPAFFLIREAKKHKADLYIAHNLGALPAAVIAAKKHKKPSGFDAEDLHRFELSNNIESTAYKITKTLEDKYIPLTNYLTASGPQIAKFYNTLYPSLKPLVILNVFNKKNISLAKPGKPLKLFWFSQTIGPSRGIEDVVKALATLNKDNFEVHLLGHRPAFNKLFFDGLTSGNVNIKFHDPIAPDDIIAFASQFDIGLALEPGFSTNNHLALSNKIFSYMQAGLAIVASETSAQHEFMSENPAIGSTYPIGDVQALAKIISAYHQQPEKLISCKEASLRSAHNRYNWEAECQKFLKLIKETL